jgi:hypothetical protein
MTEIDFESQLRTIAKGIDYPHTPAIAGHVMMRIRPAARPRFISKTVAWSLITILIFISSLFFIPSARAAIIEFIQIGIVRILKPKPIASPLPIESPQVIPIPIAATPGPTTQPLIPILNQVIGQTTLDQAAARVRFPILLPSYPSDVEQPDLVFVQAADGDLVILIWLEPQNHEKVKMSLHLVSSGSWAIRKFQPVVVEETRVHGTPAVWTSGPYPLLLQNGDIEVTRLIEGHVLIWADDNVTYRLETDLPLEEAVKIAESLQPVP